MASEKKIVLITGANTGLGFEIAKALFKSSVAYHILIGCRGDMSRAEEAIATLKTAVPNTNSTAEGLSVDISSDESIQNAFNTVAGKFNHIDVLVNNAGAAFVNLTTREAWRSSWDTNVTGTHILTMTFMPLLLASPSLRQACLIFITSGMSSLSAALEAAPPHHAIPPVGWPKEGVPSPALAYRAAKTGLNMVALDWARCLRNDGVRVFNVSPGLLATGLGGDRERLVRRGALYPAVGGQLVRDVIEGARDADAGGRVVRGEGVQPW